MRKGGRLRDPQIGPHPFGLDVLDFHPTGFKAAYHRTGEGWLGHGRPIRSERSGQLFPAGRADLHLFDACPPRLPGSAHHRQGFELAIHVLGERIKRSRGRCVTGPAGVILLRPFLADVGCEGLDQARVEAFTELPGLFGRADLSAPVDLLDPFEVVVGESGVVEGEQRRALEGGHRVARKAASRVRP
jgi:hypothetical protein